MDLKNLKITNYEDSVSTLPDYPSDAGITAAQLKAIFDGRTDKEIKERFNALIDELITRFQTVEVDIADAVEDHQNWEEAHIDLFTPIRERIAEIIGQLISIEAALGEKADALEIENRFREMESLLSGMDSILIGKADRDELEKHTKAFDNPHGVTAAQIGALTSESFNDELGKYLPDIENDIGALQGQVGDIEAALDAILAIQNELIGGETV